MKFHAYDIHMSVSNVSGLWSHSATISEHCHVSNIGRCLGYLDRPYQSQPDGRPVGYRKKSSAFDWERIQAMLDQYIRQIE